MVAFALLKCVGVKARASMDIVMEDFAIMGSVRRIIACTDNDDQEDSEEEQEDSDIRKIEKHFLKSINRTT